jgi:hypothetical protein
VPGAGKQAVSGIETREVIVHPLPPPDRLVLEWEQNPVCFITEDGTSLCGALAEKLIARNWKIVVLQWPTSESQAPSALPEGIRTIQLHAMNEDQIEAALIKAEKTFGPASAMIYLEPNSADRNKEMNLQAAFWLAKYLKPALTDSSMGGRNAFLTVTRMDGALGTSGDGNWSAISGGLFGLVKTLNLEWENVFCRALDIQNNLSAEQAADDILAEMEDPDQTLVEVGISTQERVTLTLANTVRSTQK